MSYTTLMARLYSIDPDAFATISTEAQAYCVGFLLADGWVQHGSRGVTVAVSEPDISVLDYIRACCKSNAPTFKKVRKGGHADGGTLLGVHLCSKKMTADLAKFGIVSNKSVSTFVPQIKANLRRHLIRGIFDGDGSIGTRQFWLIGSANMLADIVRLSRHIGASFNVSINNGYPRIIGSRKDAPFLDWIYRDCEFALPRKLAAYLEHW